jgi:nitrite reductase/ring-hydroxylating ferredoxin subunit
MALSFAHASGSGNHSHGHQPVEKSLGNDAVTYKDSKDGVDAYLEFCDFKGFAGKEAKEFVVKCNTRAYLKDSKTGAALEPSKLLLRATIGHDQFGEAMIFSPVNDNKMQTELFVKKKGEHHYLLIAEIEGVGIKEFHFHHTF